jgi:hypothetical protein
MNWFDKYSKERTVSELESIISKIDDEFKTLENAAMRPLLAKLGGMPTQEDEQILDYILTRKDELRDERNQALTSIQELKDV